MSSSTPSSPARRKSGSVTGAPSPERRRSNRLASISNARTEPEGEVEAAHATDDASVDGDESESKLAADDDASPSDGSSRNADGVKPPPIPLSTRFNPWNFGEKPCTIRRVYLNGEKKQDDNEKKASSDDGKQEGEEKDVKKDEDNAEDDVDANGNDDENYEQAEALEIIKAGGWEDWRRDSQGGNYNKVIDPLPDFREQPPARSSNAQAVPPIYEDRGIKFKSGGRFINNADGTQIDQEKHLFLKLVDMRAKSKNDKEPKRQLVTWHNKNGAPNDWNDKYAIKKLNAAHQENIRSICRDFTWSQSEADFIAQQFKDKPKVSIRELAYHFNNYFIGDFYLSSPEEWDVVHTGSTIESIRSEYLAHKDDYDNGEAPKKPELRGKYFMHANGLSEEQMKNIWTSANGGKAPIPVTQPRAKKDKAQNKTKKSSSASAGKTDNQASIPRIKKKEDYKTCTIPELKLLARHTKPEGFLRGLKKKGDIVTKFEDDHDGDGNTDADADADADADTDAEDGAADDALDGGIKGFLYTTMPKKGLPNYKGKLNFDQVKELARRRSVRLRGLIGTPGSASANVDDYVRALEADDEAKGRYRKARERYDRYSEAKKTSKKRPSPSSTEKKSNKKQKTQEFEDIGEATDPNDSTTALPSSLKRKSFKGSEGPISSRKTSLRSSSSKSNSTAVAAEESIPVTEEEEQQVDGEDEDAYPCPDFEPPSDKENEQSKESDVSEEE